MRWLNDTIEFPPLSEANNDGLLAVGGDLSSKRVLLAYQSGIFPWYEANQPLLWWAPNPRFVLYPSKLKVSKSSKRLLKSKKFEVSVNRNFKDVILACAKVKRQSQSGTWITDKMIDVYCELHQMGFAKSVEVWLDNKLVGGLYGVQFNEDLFCGESMFSYVSNASKIGFISFIQMSKFKLIDCQVHSSHLESLGAEKINRSDFMQHLTPFQSV
ncbi:MAG: leucyl/phenylalanyl-tRNA--protein transferase [Flavobacteriales bacterium]|jgi:leucyl/phenylalanyl-tRNA--protein transferase|tara:strand:+ start:950 stop:1591 length:642 start_codon:yes stop_codon:yes gene_type:complete